MAQFPPMTWPFPKNAKRDTMGVVAGGVFAVGIRSRDIDVFVPKIRLAWQAPRSKPYG